MDTFIPILGAVLGAIVGALTTILVTRIKTKQDRSKELMRLAVKAGIESFNSDRKYHSNTELVNRPMSFYIYFHYHFLHLVESGKATSEELKKVHDKQIELLESVKSGPWGQAFGKSLETKTDIKKSNVDSGIDAVPPVN